MANDGQNVLAFPAQKSSPHVVCLPSSAFIETRPAPVENVVEFTAFYVSQSEWTPLARDENDDIAYSEMVSEPYASNGMQLRICVFTPLAEVRRLLREVIEMVESRTEEQWAELQPLARVAFKNETLKRNAEEELRNVPF